ncbi:putative WRKY transcription factor 70 [Acorus gramineus]|uniref:WRKY transcription factor 70 n=1 Tax=Acorus gramineus TaxID=55184 RepID=A0AAV9B6Y2_ACOGR|nr:putative WRKY transcription factor 70 [Acorus gramineus]
MSCDRKGVIEGEIIRGQGLATELQNLLLRPNGGDLLQVRAVMLVEGISRSIAKALSLLRSKESPDVSNFSASCSTDPRINMKRKKSSRSSTVDVCNGSKKRRGATGSITWTINSAAPLHDEHQWRKYGQKEIRNSKFPRSYYRCSDEQSCPATKQVQQLDHSDPPMYHVVYHNDHKCVHNSMTSNHHPATGTTQRDEHPPNYESNGLQSSSEENSFLSAFATFDQSIELSSEGWSLEHIMTNYGMKPEPPLPNNSDSPFSDALNNIGEGVDANLLRSLSLNSIDGELDDDLFNLFSSLASTNTTF